MLYAQRLILAACFAAVAFTMAFPPQIHHRGYSTELGTWIDARSQFDKWAFARRMGTIFSMSGALFILAGTKKRRILAGHVVNESPARRAA